MKNSKSFPNQSNPNKGGRPKGAVNKVKSDIRHIVECFFAGNLERILNDVLTDEATSPTEKASVLSKYLSFVIAKHKEVTATIEINEQRILSVEILPVSPALPKPTHTHAIEEAQVVEIELPAPPITIQHEST